MPTQLSDLLSSIPLRTESKFHSDRPKINSKSGRKTDQRKLSRVRWIWVRYKAKITINSYKCDEKTHMDDEKYIPIIR